MEVQLAFLRVVHGAAAVALGMPVVQRLLQILPPPSTIEGDLQQTGTKELVLAIRELKTHHDTQKAIRHSKLPRSRSACWATKIRALSQRLQRPCEAVRVPCM